jgi:transcriptional regulator with XRE-family HTH domain
MAKDNFDIKLGAALKAARKRKGMTQEQVANRLNVTKMAISHWERGDRSMYAADLLRFCDAVGADVNEIIKETD